MVWKTLNQSGDLRSRLISYTTACLPIETLMWWTVPIINECCMSSPVRIAYFLPYAIWTFLGGLFQCLFNYFRTSWSWTFEAYLQVAGIALLRKHKVQSSKRSLTNIYNYFSEFCCCWNEFPVENEIENFQDHRLSYDSNRISTFLCAVVQEFPNGNTALLVSPAFR